MPDTDEGPEEALIRRFEQEDLYEMLESLHESYCDVLTMRYLYNLSDEEIGTAMGIKAASVRVVVHRALKALKKAYALREEGENR